MRLRIFAISILAVVSSMACSHDDGNKNNNGKVTVADVTDRSQCGVGTATSIEGTWSFTAKANNGGQVVASYAIGRDSTTLTFQCSANGVSVENSTTSRSSYTSSQYNVLETTSNNSVSSCPVSLPAGSVSYQLSGSCLQITDGANSLILVPRYGAGHAVSQSGFQPIDRSQVPTDPDFQMPKMPKMPKMPTMHQDPDQDDNE